MHTLADLVAIYPDTVAIYPDTVAIYPDMGSHKAGKCYENALAPFFRDITLKPCKNNKCNDTNGQGDGLNMHAFLSRRGSHLSRHGSHLSRHGSHL